MGGGPSLLQPPHPGHPQILTQRSGERRWLSNCTMSSTPSLDAPNSLPWTRLKICCAVCFLHKYGFYYQKEATASEGRHNSSIVTGAEVPAAVPSASAKTVVTGLRHLGLPSTGAQPRGLRAEPLGIVRGLWPCVQAQVLPLVLKVDIQTY